MRMELSNVRKSTKGDKRTVICDVGTAQYENETIKCEKKSKRTSNVRKKKVTCDVGIAQCENEIVKCDKKEVKKPPNMTKKL